MSSFSRRLAGGAAISALLVAGQPALSATGPAAPFTFADLAGGLLRLMVPYARMVADIRYGAIEVDRQRGAVTLRDLQVAGIGAYETCWISMGAAQVSGLQLLASEDMRMRLDLTDLEIATNCFGPQAAMIGMVTGGPAIPVERLTIDSHQIVGSGAAEVSFELVSPGIARVEGEADFGYFAMYVPDFFQKLVEENQPDDDGLSGDDPFYDDPAMPAPEGEAPADDGAAFAEEGTDRGDLGVTDAMPPEPSPSEEGGAPNAAEEAMPGPEDFPSPWADQPAPETSPPMAARGTLNAAHVSVEDLGVWARLQPLLPPEATSPESLSALVSAAPGSELAAIQQGLADAIGRFVAAPGRVTAEIRPEAPIDFDSSGWQTAEEPVVLMAPVFTNELPRPPVALIVDPSAAGDARSLGLALARGEGVPQNRRRAVGLLSPIKGDAEVSLTLAGLLAEADATAAYPHAMAAAQQGTSGAAGLLGALESRMPTAALMAAQAPGGAPLPDEVFASVPALRDAALAREAGHGVARSYALAWRLATSAAAAGDGAAEALMARLDARFAGDPAWITAREAAADAAMADWTKHQLGNRLAGPAAQ